MALPDSRVGLPEQLLPRRIFQADGLSAVGVHGQGQEFIVDGCLHRCSPFLLPVDDVLAVSVEEGAQVPGGDIHQILQRFLGRPCNVRGEDGVGFLPQGAFLRERLSAEGIGP